MAALTSRVRIGVLVTGNSYRHPGMLAKIGSTVDHLSGGRLEMGIGAGWAQREFTMLDLPFGTAGQRISQLSEACKILKMLWSDEPEINFEGRHYRLVDAISNPKPVQRPHPPLWVGGRGVKKLLRVAAEEADVWNTTSRDFDEEVQLSKVLDRHCEDIGRDPSTIRRSMQLYYRGDVEDFLGQAKRYRGAGFTEIVVTLYVDDAPKGAETVATEILPRLRELG
jgi:alkanesulfonate monooxygenase SsuD/methylene tetrahydromethanopterin reductase-like flavin-dependent oxidoreductase (luciferase family)